MKWLFGIIVLILLVVSARFRKFAGFVVLICIVGGALLWGYQEYEKNKSKSRISASEVTLENISFETRNNNYELTGRIVNNSEKYILNGLQLKITVKDCTNNDDTHCIIFAEKKEYIYLSIPPRQARDFKKDIYLYLNQSIENKLAWDYSIEYAESE